MNEDFEGEYEQESGDHEYLRHRQFRVELEGLDRWENGELLSYLTRYCLQNLTLGHFFGQFLPL